jgi:hypothetical protein
LDGFDELRWWEWTCGSLDLGHSVTVWERVRERHPLSYTTHVLLIIVLEDLAIRLQGEMV